MTVNCEIKSPTYLIFLFCDRKKVPYISLFPDRYQISHFSQWDPVFQWDLYYLELSVSMPLNSSMFIEISHLCSWQLNSLPGHVTNDCRAAADIMMTALIAWQHHKTNGNKSPFNSNCNKVYFSPFKSITRFKRHYTIQQHLK